MEKETENLKSVDLMLGDYVICHHPSKPQEIVNVTSGLLSIIERQENGIIDSNSPLYRVVQPIPLTAEILENNGFLPCDSPTVKMYGGFGKYYRPYRGLRYVHELQHALRLFKIKKEIIL